MTPEAPTLFDFGIGPRNTAAENNANLPRINDYFAANPHATILAPAKERGRDGPVLLRISEPLVIENPGKLIGDGGGGAHNVGSANDYGVAWLWEGAADPEAMIAIAPIAGVSNRALVGVEFSGFNVYGQDLAPGLSLKSIHNGKFKRLYFQDGRGFCLRTGIVATLGDASDFTSNDLELSFKQFNANPGPGVLMTGDEYHNSCKNDIRIVLGSHHNGPGIDCQNSDNNKWRAEVWRTPAGTAPGVILRGGPTNAQRARQEKFHTLATTNSYIAVEGTDVAARASTDHAVLDYEFGNAYLPWQTGPGASLDIRNLLCRFGAGKNTGSFTGGAWADISNWALSYAHGCYFNSWFNATTGVFTAPQNGVYRLSMQLTHTPTITPGSRWHIQMTRSGIGSNRGFSYTPKGAIYDTVSMNYEVTMLAGETIKPQIRNVGGGGVFDVCPDATLSRFEGSLVR